MIALIFFCLVVTIASSALFVMSSTNLERFLVVFLFVASTSIVCVKSMDEYKANPRCFYADLASGNTCGQVLLQNESVYHA